MNTRTFAYLAGTALAVIFMTWSAMSFLTSGAVAAPDKPTMLTVSPGAPQTPEVVTLPPGVFFPTTAAPYVAPRPRPTRVPKAVATVGPTPPAAAPPTAAPTSPPAVSVTSTSASPVNPAPDGPPSAGPTQ